MIYLGAKRANYDSIAGVWKTDLHDFLFKKRKDECQVKDGYTVVSEHKTYYEKMVAEVEYWRSKNKINADDEKWIKKELTYYKDNFKTIVLADRTTLEEEGNAYVVRTKIVSDKAHNTYYKLMKDLYTAFTQQADDNGVARSHLVFKNLKISTCPYCNMQYTFTLDCGNGKTSPEYDHFYDKSDYPILALSFYNLVPSCHVCNHIKGTKKTVSINPFFAGFESCFVFVDNDDDNKVLTKAEVMKQGGGRILLRKADGKESASDKGNIKTFALNELYAMQDKYISEIVEKVPMYDELYTDLATTFQTKAKTPQEVFDFVWGRHLMEAEYEDRPLSKLTKDLLEQLEIMR